MEKLYTMKQLAEVLQINVQTAQRFCRENNIKSIKVGRNYMVKDSALEEYLSYPQKSLTDILKSI